MATVSTGYTFSSGESNITHTKLNNAINNATVGTILLASDVSGQLPIANGGTGQASKTAGFDALSPLSTAGDLLYFTTSNVRLAIGAANRTLCVNAAGTAPEYAVPHSVIIATHDVSVTGDQSVTGAGFLPSKAIILANVSGGYGASIGVLENTTTGCIFNNYGGTAGLFGSAATTYPAWLQEDAAKYSRIVGKTWDADGVTVTWSKASTPTGTAYLMFIFFR